MALCQASTTGKHLQQVYLFEQLEKKEMFRDLLEL